MLALAKKVITRHELLKQGIWERSKSIQLQGKTVGIVGLGSVGIELAKRAKCFGMRIIAIKRHPSPDLAKILNLGFLGGPADLAKILKESDFVVLTLPLTYETDGLIGEKELMLMKNSAFIINVSRGSIIREDALYKALIERRIAGAGIDTWWAFDPNTPSKLGIHKLDNIVGTSHIGGSTIEFLESTAKIIAQNIERIAKNQTPLNLIDLDLRY
jgi:phosphoglycerate dehydrogenase-like enzyme